MLVGFAMLCGLVFLPTPAMADELSDLRAENARLNARVDRLEADLAEIKVLLQARAPAPAPAPPVGKAAVTSKFPVQLYGYVKADASYDSDRTDEGNDAKWVRSFDAVEEGDDQFNLTARQSRFGLNFGGPDFGDGESSGKVEIDFYVGGAENKDLIMMRHCYLKMNWPDSDFSILAGQTSDVISPLVPTTLNHSVGWWAGDLGYRRPQLRFTKGFGDSMDSRLEFQLAAARTIGDNGPFGAGADTGEDAGVPSVQGRAALSFPLFTDKPTTIGVSGHYGREEFDYNGEDDSDDLDTWSANLDLTVPLFDRLTFKGELWTGENMDAYLGGVAQGIVLRDACGAQYVNGAGWDPSPKAFDEAWEIGALGGWGALSLGPFNDAWNFNLGAGVDDAKGNDIPSGARSRNASYWGNALYDINEAVRIGLELSYWDTDHKDMADGDSFPIQSSLIYKFYGKCMNSFTWGRFANRPYVIC